MSQVPERFANLPPLKRAVLALQEVQAKLDAVERARTEPIAIVGVGCRIPGGVTDPDSFWQLLKDGVCAVRDTPADRWDVDALYDPNPDAPGKICTRRGSYIDGVDEFDARFFGIAPREAAAMDPQQRLFLEVAWQAFEHAGIAADRLSGSRTGVFVGIAASDYVEVLRDSDQSRIDAYHASGIAHSIASGRLSYILGLQGPSISVDTACSSSLVAVHLAVQSLRSGECRMALAGGVNLILTPTNGIIFSKSHMLAADGCCKTFDAAADGFGRGEGCGVVVLKRLSDAAADGDRILAVIRGSAANQDGPSSGLTAPNGPAQESVIRDALANAGVKPSQVGYVEAHGTGTALGDPIEVQALGAALREGRDPDRPVIVGSLKTNVGHLEAAAGVAGLIKVVLSLQHEAIPAHLHLRQLNPHVAWDELPIRVPTTLTPWSHGGEARIAGISSFGFSGTNVHLVIEEAPAATARTPAGSAGRSLVTVSARGERALRSRIEQLASHLSATPVANLDDVAHTLNAGRAHLPVRIAIQAGSRDELVSGLRGLLTDDGSVQGAVDVTATPRPKIAFLFTGQGSQYPGMGRELYETQPVFREAMDRCDAILQPLLATPLLPVIYGNRTELLDQTAYTQPALFAVEYTLATLWRSWGIEPSVLLGHSIGEYVAACVAGVMSLDDALALVAERGRLMQALPAGGAMAAVFAGEARVLPFIQDRPSVSLAAVNGPSSVVVSGTAADVEAIVEELAQAGIKSKPLNVSHAFHSPLMDPALDAFEAAAAKVRFNAPRVKVISNLTGRVASAAELTSPKYWRDHLRGTVRFEAGIRTIDALGIRAVVEAGPQPTLIGLGMQCLTGVDVAWVPSLRQGRAAMPQLLDGVAALYGRNADVNWAALDSRREARRVTLPGYPFERERFWLDRAVRTPDRRQTPGRHPIITGELSSPAISGRVFEGRISSDEHRYLYDHVVHDTAILPATGFLELALGAAREMDLADVQLTDVSIREALALPSDGELSIQVVVTEDGAERSTFRIYSGSPAAGWTLHVEGTFVKAPVRQQAELVLDLPQGTEITPDTFYAGLSDRGLVFGPAFRTVTELRTCEGRAAGTARIAELLRTDDERFVIHPVLLDGAVQVLAGALTSDGTSTESYLPVFLESFDIVAGVRGAVAASASIRPGNSQELLVADLVLFDASDPSRQVGRVTGLKLKRAGRAALHRVTRRDIGDWLYETEWEPLPVVAANPLWIPAVDTLTSLPVEDVARIASSSGLDHYDAALPQMEALSAGYVAAALAELGFALTSGEHHNEEALFAGLGIVPHYRKLFTRLVQILEEVGVLARQQGGIRVTRSWQPDVQQLRTAALRHQEHCDAELTLLERCGPHLASVLRGTADPLALLFPGGSAETAERLYQESSTARAFNGLIGEAIGQVVRQRPAGTRLRVLEIGGGTGATTSYVLPRLPQDGLEYVFTDISPMFTARAARKFSEFPAFRSQPLNVERSPFEQGLEPASFDLIVAANVLHATADLEETFEHVRELLKPHGLLTMLEVTKPQRWIDLTFGLTDGWWRFVDYELRPDYPLIGTNEWIAFLGRAGFGQAAAVETIPEISDAFGLQSILFARNDVARAARSVEERTSVVLQDHGGIASAAVRALENRGRRVHVIDRAEDLAKVLETTGVSEVISFRALDVPRGVPATVGGVNDTLELAGSEALSLVQQLATRGAQASLWLLTSGAQGTDAIGAVSSPLQAAVWGLGKVAALEHPELRCTRVDLDPDDPLRSVAALVELVCSGSSEDQIALRAGSAFVPRLARAAEHVAADSGPYRLGTTARGTLENLAFHPAVRRLPAPGQIEVEVQLSALNFKDVMNALGLYPGDPGPLGSEAAGRVSAIGEGVTAFAVGDEVVGVAPGSFARFVHAPAGQFAKKPAALTLEEAATLPIAFLTAQFALGHLAQMKRGDRVLIHAAAGGVGLAAVQLAQRAGAEVFATAGTPEKRALLTSLGVEHVMSSRTPEFADVIRGLTDDRGVDIVLNSLAGDLLDRSFDVLAHGGRFLEIGKNGLWSPERVAGLQKDVKYFVIDWGVDLRTNPTLIEAMFRELIAAFDGTELHPLPYRVFPLAETVDAFRFMAQGKHTGKLLVAHDSRPALVTAPLVRANATYLITGGLSGLGLATAQRLVEHGATHLVLASRSGMSDEARGAISRMEAGGANVTAVQADVTSEHDVARLFARIDDHLPPLAGIIHSAGVLDDGALVQQNWARFVTVLGPKVAGACNLHNAAATRALDFFVSYSSVASVFGSAGQGNHAAANAVLDAFAGWRRANGLAGLSINWGAWSEIGAAARLGVAARAGSKGIGTIAPQEGLAALDRLMDERRVQTAVVAVDWPVFARQNGDRLGAFFSRVSARSNAVTNSTPAAQAMGLLQQLEETPAGGRLKLITSYVRERAARVLGGPLESVDPRRPLNEQGLDSLMAVELRNVLGTCVQRQLSATLLFDYPTVDAVAAQLASMLGVGPAAEEQAPATDVLDQIDELSDEEIDRLLAARLAGQP